MKKLLRLLLRWLGDDAIHYDCSGKLAPISAGVHEIPVSLKFTPKEIWLKFSPHEDGGDFMECRIGNDGFVVTATVYSDDREIEWVAVQ